MKLEKTTIKEITPLSDRDCFYIADRQKTEFTYPIHVHEEYELNFVAQAKGVKRIVGDSIETIDDYDLVLITSKELEHAWIQHECTSKNIREITIQFSPNLFNEGFINKNQFTSILQMLDKAQRGLSFPMNAIMNIYPTLNKLFSNRTEFYSVIDFITILYELSLSLNECKILSSSSFAKIGTHSDNRRIQIIKDYINKNYAEDISLERLTDLASMASSSFSRFFKLRTGKNISDYIIDIRLGHATRLLVDTTMSISEICFGCGFNNLSNFNRLFKKRKKCTPKEFRENYKKKMRIV